MVPLCAIDFDGLIVFDEVTDFGELTVHGGVTLSGNLVVAGMLGMLVTKFLRLISTISNHDMSVLV